MTEAKPRRKPRRLELAGEKGTKTVRIPVSIEVVRDMARMEYVSDLQVRSVADTYAREDREYRNTIQYATFRRWAEVDHWDKQRAEFWEKQERVYLAERSEQVLARRIKEADLIHEGFDAWMEYLLPEKDSEGKIKRYDPGHELAGLPKFKLPPNGIKDVIKAAVELGKMAQNRRGDITERVSVTAEVRHTVDPVVQRLAVPIEVLREISSRVLEQRQPELLEAEILDIPLELGDGSEKG